MSMALFVGAMPLDTVIFYAEVVVVQDLAMPCTLVIASGITVFCHLVDGTYRRQKQ
jgi:hypothetical protein